MPVICWDFMGNLPFTGNLQEVSGLLYPTSTDRFIPWCRQYTQGARGQKLDDSKYSTHLLFAVIPEVMCTFCYCIPLLPLIIAERLSYKQLCLNLSWNCRYDIEC